MNRAPIRVMELNELRGKNEDQQNKINNSAKLRTAGAGLEDELWQLTLGCQNTRVTSRDTKITCKRWESEGVLQDAG